MNLSKVYQNLKEDNYRFQFPLKDKFYVFKIENFLDQESYNFIDKNFYNFSKENLKQTFLKYSVKSNEETYKKNVQNNRYLSEIDKLFTSKEFNYFFLKKLYFKILKSRIGNNHFLRMFKIQKFNEPTKSRIISNLETRVEYSFLVNGAVVNQHTDAVKKMLSLMLYFPDDNANITLDEQKKFGTQFWNSKKENFRNEHIQNKRDISSFKNENKIAYTTPFEKFHLYGFIKNKYSWHSVDKIEAPSNYFRRSININIFFS
tara:strand:- start:3585 stop:4364 length:780 start_codon:yes stop_codon:yes gene_type:complete